MGHALRPAFDLTTAMHPLQSCPAVHGMCIVLDSPQNLLICHSSAWLMHCSSDFWLCICIWLTVNSGQCLNWIDAIFECLQKAHFVQQLMVDIWAIAHTMQHLSTVVLDMHGAWIFGLWSWIWSECLGALHSFVYCWLISVCWLSHIFVFMEFLLRRSIICVILDCGHGGALVVTGEHALKEILVLQLQKCAALQCAALQRFELCWFGWVCVTSSRIIDHITLVHWSVFVITYVVILQNCIRIWTWFEIIHQHLSMVWNQTSAFRWLSILSVFVGSQSHTWWS